jgi:hypothetical protein
MVNVRRRGVRPRQDLLHAVVLDKPGQVFKPAIYSSLRVSLSESGFYGSRVRGIRTIEHPESHQEVIALIKRRKLLILLSDLRHR